MSTGTGPNLTGDKIANIFNRAGYLARSAFTEGMVAVAWNGSGADMFDVCLPNDADAYAGGRAFIGIWMNAGTATSGTDRGPVQKLGVAQCRLKASTACQAGQLAAYDPTDGGTVVPWTSGKQIPIGRFSQTKASNASGVTFVGVELDAAIAGGPQEFLVGSVITNSSNITNSVAETAFDQSVSIPANLLSAGAVLRIRGKVNVTSGNANDTLTLRLRLGGLTGVLLAAGPAIDVTDGGGDLGVFDAVVTVRSIGAAGTVTSAATVGLGVPGTATMRVAGSAGTLTVDTTAALTVVGTAQWSVANAGNICRLEDLSVSLLRASV